VALAADPLVLGPPIAVVANDDLSAVPRAFLEDTARALVPMFALRHEWEYIYPTGSKCGSDLARTCLDMRIHLEYNWTCGYILSTKWRHSRPSAHAHGHEIGELL